jgi:hypothetical protein
MVRPYSPLAIALIAAGAASADGTFVSGTAEPSSVPANVIGITSQSSGVIVPQGMSTARTGHTATRLIDGRVLVAGGSGSSLSYITAELYQPAEQAFKPIADMRYGRSSHTATLLPSGYVLIAGGADQSGIPLSAAELFIPASATFTLVQPMTTARVSPSATLLKTNQVLIAGGSNNANGVAAAISSAELFNTATRTFARTGSMSRPRAGHVAVLLPNGRVLIIGGDTAGNTAEIFDPNTGRFSPTGSMLQSRTWFTATLISGGNVLITGGFWGGSVLSSAEIYETASSRFLAIPAMSVARALHTATALLDGTVLIAGGRSGLRSSPSWCYPTAYVLETNSVERFNPVTRQFTSNADFLTVARQYHSATRLLTGDVLVTGGATPKITGYCPLGLHALLTLYRNTPTATAELIR